jgi:hypothetical protein
MSNIGNEYYNNIIIFLSERRHYLTYLSFRVPWITKEEIRIFARIQMRKKWIKNLNVM